MQGTEVQEDETAMTWAIREFADDEYNDARHKAEQRKYFSMRDEAAAKLVESWKLHEVNPWNDDDLCEVIPL